MDFYELGKWLGDRRGYPRVGIVNTEVKLITDTKQFLEKTFNRKAEIYTITKKNRRTMLGKKAYETYFVDGKLHRQLDSYIEKNIKKGLSKEKSLAFLGGFIDAEGTIDPKNYQVVISIGKKNKRVKKLILKILKQLPVKYRYWDCKKEWKISLVLDNNLKKQIKNYIKHPKKKRLLDGELSFYDEKFLGYIKKIGKLDSYNLSERFNIHIDHSRRILRYFLSLGLVGRNNHRPYLYYPK